jgi:hypothetical protein
LVRFIQSLTQMWLKLYFGFDYLRLIWEKPLIARASYVAWIYQVLSLENS